MTEINNRHISKVLFIPFLLLAMLFSGCNNRPKEVIGEKKLVRLMADMELAEAYANMSNQSSQGKDYRYELGKSVLAAHGVSREQLDTTLAWYGTNLDDYSKLYAKVDKEILNRKKKLMNLSDEEMEMQEGDILWKYGKNGLLSNLGYSDSWIFSVDDPELQKGDRLQWSMHIDAPVQMNGVLGVEYEDGSSEASSNVFIGRNRLEMTFQTDTAKSVKRVYGTMRLKDEKQMPLFADSIAVVRLPYDSVEFRSARNVKRYGIPVVRKPKKEEKADTVDSAKEGIEKAPFPSDNNKPLMWNGGSGNPSGDRPEQLQRSVPPKNERVRPERPNNPKPVPPHEQGGVMHPVKKEKIKKNNNVIK